MSSQHVAQSSSTTTSKTLAPRGLLQCHVAKSDCRPTRTKEPERTSSQTTSELTAEEFGMYDQAGESQEDPR